MQILNIRSLLNSLILSTFLFSCNSSSDTGSHSPGPQNLIGKKTSIDIKLSDLESRDPTDVNKLFDSIHYIPLQTTKNNLFSMINQMEVTRDYFIVLDWATNSILVFGKDGGFKFKIKGVSIREFNIDESRGHIVFQDYLSRKMYTYNFKGELVAIRKVPFYNAGHAYLDSNRIAFYRYFIYEKDVKNFNYSNLLISDDSCVVKQGLLPYDTTTVNYKEVYSSEKQFYKSNQNVYFIQPFENKIFGLKNSSSIDYISLNLPGKYKLPDDFLTNKKYFNKRMQYIKDNPYQTFLIKNFYIVHSLMVFETMGSEWNDVFLYDPAKKKAYSTYNFMSGPKNNCLPLGLHFLAADDESFYRSVSAKQLFNPKQVQQVQLTYSKLPKQLKTFYETQNNLSNPIIVQFFPKKG
jgi:hypothetical protein